MFLSKVFYNIALNKDIFIENIAYTHKNNQYLNKYIFSLYKCYTT